MDAMKSELIDYLTKERNAAILAGKMTKAQWLNRWICGLRSMDVNRKRNAVMVAHWYCELHTPVTTQLSLF